MKRQRAWSSYAVLFVAMFLLDRVTKALVIGLDKIVRVAPFLSIQRCFNRGISWGMLHSNNSSMFVAIVIMTLAIIIPLFIYAVTRHRRSVPVWGETLVLVGAISNLIDRFIYGGVVDFISFSYGSWSWPVFNIADACIVSGVFLIILSFSKEG